MVDSNVLHHLSLLSKVFLAFDTLETHYGFWTLLDGLIQRLTRCSSSLRSYSKLLSYSRSLEIVIHFPEILTQSLLH